MIKGYALLKDTSHSREFLTVMNYCLSKKIDYLLLNFNDKLPEGYIPNGTAEWCLKLLNKKIVPDYYPDFLKDHLHRKVWKSNDWPLGKRVFIKPADSYKRFTGFVTNGGCSKKKEGRIFAQMLLTSSTNGDIIFAMGIF